MAHNKNDLNQPLEASRLPLSLGAEPRIVTVDYDLYAHFLEDSELSEEQKREFLQALWNIVVEFVSLGFGVHPTQQNGTACGKNSNEVQGLTIPKDNTLQFVDQDLVEKFNNMQSVISDREKKGEGRV